MIFVEISLFAVLGFMLWAYQNSLVSFFHHMEGKLLSTSKKNWREPTKNLLYASGKNSAHSGEWLHIQWHILKWLMLFSVILSLVFAKPFWLMVPAFLLFQYYRVLVDVRERKQKILLRLPFVLDMLVLNLESGLDFITSLEELGKMDERQPLHQEIKITLQGIRLGKTRSEAFSQLAARTRVAELANLAAVIGQSEQMGSSLTELLRLQSHELRHRIFRMAESQAQKTPVKILLPMIMFIFPVIFILLFVPIAIQLLRIF